MGLLDLRIYFLWTNVLILSVRCVSCFMFDLILGESFVIYSPKHHTSAALLKVSGSLCSSLRRLGPIEI